MGVIIAVIIWPNGARLVVIPERYPQPGAQSRRLTDPRARNPATSGGSRTVVRPGQRSACRAWMATSGWGALPVGQRGPWVPGDPGAWCALPGDYGAAASAAYRGRDDDRVNDRPVRHRGDAEQPAGRRARDHAPDLHHLYLAAGHHGAGRPAALGMGQYPGVLFPGGRR